MTEHSQLAVPGNREPAIPFISLFFYPKRPGSVSEPKLDPSYSQRASGVYAANELIAQILEKLKFHEW